MRYIKDSSFDEYAVWFFEREMRKEGGKEVPGTPEDRLAEFHGEAKDKYREWFPKARWTVQRLEDPKEMESLMVVSASFTREHRLWNPGEQRLLGVEARNAIRHDYFRTDPNSGRHRDYYNRLRTGRLELRGADRLVLLSLEDTWRREAPDTTYYLHDGFGRALPYMMLLEEEAIQFAPVEVFLAERQ